MKKEIMKALLLFLLILPFLIGTGCNKEFKENKGDIIHIIDVPIIVDYQKLSLHETTWKLIGFVSSEQNTIKIAEPKDERCYTLKFKLDGTYQGQTSTNIISGKYEVNLQNETLKIIDSFGTEINERFDGNLYLTKVHQIEAFSITERGLALYYEDKSHYLLYTPVK